MIKRWQVKFILPTCGLFGLYLGAFIAVFFISRHSDPVSSFTEFLLVAVFALGAGTAVMIPVDSKLGPEASHVDILKIPLYWAVVGLALYLIHIFAERVLGVLVPAVVENLIIWGAGVFAVWVEEPEGTNLAAIDYKTLSRIRKRSRPKAS